MSLLILLLLAGAADASTLRCGSALVSTGDHALEVLDKCGEPASRAFLGYRQYGDHWGNFERLRIEEWIYGPRSGMYHYLRFEGDRLVDIDSRRRR
ncbi:DUF2845 domain-containing protein [Pseudomonas stutzeri]|nr:DUF2845 domain-containing protein [Stutzerimonas stutzeri]